jgi:hypothetical protein
VGKGSINTWLKSKTRLAGNPIENAATHNGLVILKLTRQMTQNSIEANKNPRGIMVKAYKTKAPAITNALLNAGLLGACWCTNSITKLIDANAMKSQSTMRGKNTGLNAPPKSAKCIWVVETSSAIGISTKMMAVIDRSLTLE